MELEPEDAKLVTLARATRARTQAGEGAAVRDADGRTYAAATVDLVSLQLSAVQVCVAMSVASGSPSLVAAVVLGHSYDPGDPGDPGSPLREADRAALLEAGGPGMLVHTGDTRGRVTRSTSL